MIDFGNKLRELRAFNNMSQKSAAEALHISATCYAGYEQGYREPDFKTLVKICKLYQVSADYLLGLETDEDAIIKQ